MGPFQAQAAGLVRHLKALIVEAQQELDQYELAMEAKATSLLPDEAPMPALRAVHCNRLVFLDLALFLLEQVEKGMATVVGLVRQYEHEIATVKDLVGGKVAVPKEKVSPCLTRTVTTPPLKKPGSLTPSLHRSVRSNVLSCRILSPLTQCVSHSLGRRCTRSWRRWARCTRCCYRTVACWWC